MAVPLEFISVIVPTSVLEERYPGGLEGYRRDHGSGSFAEDAHLTRVGFMGSIDVERFIGRLSHAGLVLLNEQGTFEDVAIVDRFGGPTRKCSWLEWDRGRCWLAGTDPGEVAETAAEIESRLEPGPAGRSLLGLAMGDCLGAGVEGWEAAWIREAHASTGGYVRAFRFEPMVWTDDTQQALTLVEAVKRFGVPEPEWVADRWVEMAERRVHRGTGRGFRGSVDEYARTRDPSMSGRTDRAGNGAAMRIAPTAVALRNLPDDRFVEHLLAVSLITHREGRALAGMLAVAFVARALADGYYPLRGPAGRAVLEELIGWLKVRERELGEHPSVVLDETRMHEVSSALRGVAARIVDGWDAVAAGIEAYATYCRGEPTRLGEGFVTASVVTAIAWTLSSALTFPNTLSEAVGFGADTDTVAAMCGGMAGAGTPRHVIPANWRSFAGSDELTAWARAIDDDRVLVDDLPDVVELEERLTRIVRG